MTIGKASNVNWRVITAILTASTLFFSTITTISPAFADESSAKLKALPKKSLVDDGNSQLLELKFKLEEGDSLELIRVTVDGELVVEFNAAGTVLNSGPAFELVFGSVTMLSDGYYAIGKAKGKFVIAMDKDVLGVGDHEALAEVVLAGETLTATAEFTLKSSTPPLPDLVAVHFFAPTTIMKQRNYMTFTIETNEGSAKAKEHKVAVYLSEDDELGTDDEVIGQGNVGKLKAGWFELVPVKIKVKDTEAGEKHLIVKVDATDKIQEVSEENNILSQAANITEGGPSHNDDEDESDE